MLNAFQDRLAKQQERIKTLEDTVEKLKSELVATREQNELFEFQMLEKSTEMEILQESILEVSLAEEAFEEVHEATVSNVSAKEAADLKESLRSMRNSKVIPLATRQSIVNMLAYLDSLEMAVQSTNSQSKEWAQREGDYVDRIERLQEEVELSKQKRKQAITLEIQLSEMKQTTLELERTKESHLKEIEKLKIVLQQREDQLKNKTSEKHDDSKLKTEIERLEAEVQRLKDEQRPAIKTDLERRYEETKYRLNEALETCHQYEIFIEAAKKAEDKGFVEALQSELCECKIYNEHLERQFQAQSEIIETLKRKIIQNKHFTDLWQKCSTMRGEVLEREIRNFESSNKDKETQRLVDTLRIIVQSRLNSIVPLQIALPHAKVRPSHSTDSSGCLSTGSDGMGSPLERNSDEEWPQHGSKPLTACDRSISA